MADQNPLLQTVMMLYQRALVARVQLREFTGSWGGAVEGFRKTIEEHRRAEEEYITDTVRKRRQSVEKMKQSLDEADAERRRRR